MPRKKLIRSSEMPYHITSRSNNQEWFYIPIDDVWSYFQKHLELGRKKFGVVVKASVLMSNHYHLCIYTPKANIDAFMQFFNQALGKSIARQAGRRNRIFGAAYKWSLIQQENYFLNVIRYVYQNPMRAGLCRGVEEYPYSDFREQTFSPELKKWIGTRSTAFEDDRTKKNLRKYLL